MAKTPPQFPEVDPETLTQAIRTSLAARMNVRALQAGAAPNYMEVIRGWAEGLTAAQNPSNAYFQQNETDLFNGQGGGSLLFTASEPMSVGQWVYQVSSDTVGLADRSDTETGPSVGVVVSTPSPSTVLVQTLGSYLYDAQSSLPFVPLTPDAIYYIGAAGNLTILTNAPEGGYIQEVGYAKNSLQFVLNIQVPVSGGGQLGQ
jgi:hypothetical protein